MLEGKTVNMRLMEPEDLSIISDWMNNISYMEEPVEPLFTQRELEEFYNRPGAQ